MRLYCDGIFDLLHEGHLSHFKKIKTDPTNILIVGIISDEDAEKYKRRPIYNMKKRMYVLESLEIVDKVIEKSPIVVTKAFIRENNIDVVFHAFANSDDRANQAKYYNDPIKLGIFVEVPYNRGISTTQKIREINTWADIWDKKEVV